jgi:16S rRNA (guanine966-N2)-methyltransferase
VSRGPILRILGGELRGRRLRVTGEVRPTEARVREALFSIWQPRLAGSRFLDLFAGSGAVGLEAISRGAAVAALVDDDPRVLAVLRGNCSELAPATTRIVRRRLPGASPADLGGPFDLIFADPPYAFDDYHGLLRRAAVWLADSGELAIEHSSRVEVAAVEPWMRVDRRRYGESCLSFFRLAGD